MHMLIKSLHADGKNFNESGLNPHNKSLKVINRKKLLKKNTSISNAITQSVIPELIEGILIDKKLVHKHKKENVFIYNLRRTLPRKINSSNMESQILPNLTDEESNFLLHYYSKESNPFILENENPENQDYILLSLPHVLSFSASEKYLDFNKLKFSNKKFLLNYYKRDKEKKRFYLIDNIDEETELKILQLANHNDWYISNEEKTKISDILERFDIKEIKDDSVFFSNMYVKIDHPFFFEHPNEHVPAMMITEASRQFMLALCHKFFGVPYKDVNFILKGMEISFNSYLELNYPITIVGKINEHTMRKGIIIYIDIDVTLWQRNKEAVFVKFIGKLISKNVFKALREPDKNSNIASSRYLPRSIFQNSNNISLRCDGGKKINCNLIDISEKGFMVKIHKSNEIPDAKNYEFFIYFHEIGLIQGISEIKWNKKDSNDDIIAGFKINEIEQDELDKLKASIKRFCYVNEDREII